MVPFSLRGSSARDGLKRDHRFRTFLFIVVLLLGAEAVFMAGVFLPIERGQSEEVWQSRISASSEDRRVLIETWVEDRLADASLVATYPTLIGLAAQGAQGHGSTAHAEDLLGGIVDVDHFDGAFVLGRRGNVIVERTSPGTSVSSPRFGALVDHLASSEHRVAFFERTDGKPALAFLAPLVDHAGGMDTVVGHVILVSDPNRWLYPTLLRKPGPSDTVEPVLVQREGDSIVFLSPLRHSNARPLTLRRRISESRLAAAAALRGDASFGRYVDYRGVPVLAATRAIRGTPWALVAKVDEAEVFRPAHMESALVAAVTALLTIIAAVAVYAVARSRRLRHEIELRRAQARYTDLFEHANDAILVADPSGRIVAANRGAELLYGYSREELLSLRAFDIRAEEFREQVPEQMNEVRRSHGITFETVHLTRTGQRLPVEVSSRVLATDDGERFISVVRDISARTASDERIRALNRLLRTTWEVTKLTARERSSEPLFADACRILVEHGEFAAAWIGVADAVSGRVVPVASAGAVRLNSHDQPAGSDTVIAAVRQRRAVVAGSASHGGHAAVAAFPLVVEGDVIGAMAVCSERADVFDADVVDLLGDLATDIAFASAVGAIEADRRVAQESVRRSEEKFRTAVEGAPEAIFIQTRGRFAYVNDAAVRLLGAKDKSQLLGREIREFTHPDSRVEVSARIHQLSNGQSAPLIEERLLRVDGSVMTAEVSAVPFAHEGQAGALVFLRDVSDRIAEEESRRRLAAAVEQAGESIVITDVRGRILYVNPAFTRVSGYSPEEVIGRTPAILKSGRQDDDFYRGMWETITAGELWTGHFTNRRKDGSLYEEEATISPIRNGGGRIVNFVGVKRDVTHEMAIEARLRQSQKMEAIGSLAGGVAHDFNNILQAFSSQLQVLRRRQTPADIERMVTMLEEQVKRGSSLTRQLLLFARRETAKPETFDLNDVLRTTSKMLRHLVRENIRFETRFAPKPLYISGDRSEFEQVLMNLVINAADAMPDGGHLVVTTDVSDGRCVLRVSDDGCGISEDIRERIFEPFFTTKAAGKGTGLGLAVVHGIVTRAGGTIHVVSEAGRGSVFTIEVPLSDTPGAVTQPARVQSQPGKGETILLVEDNDTVRIGLRELLSTYDYSVVDVTTAEAVDELPPATAPALLLTDVILPGVAGPVLAERLMARWPDLRVVLMSGYTDQQSIPTSIHGRSVSLLRKPFDAVELLDEIRHAMGT